MRKIRCVQLLRSESNAKYKKCFSRDPRMAGNLEPMLASGHFNACVIFSLATAFASAFGFASLLLSAACALLRKMSETYQYQHNWLVLPVVTSSYLAHPGLVPCSCMLVPARQEPNNCTVQNTLCATKVQVVLNSHLASSNPDLRWQSPQQHRKGLVATPLPSLLVPFWARPGGF